MEENPYWGIFGWHPLNLIQKRRKRKAETRMRYCNSCGKLIAEDYVHCIECGKKIGNRAEGKEQVWSPDQDDKTNLETTVECSECGRPFRLDQVARCYDCGNIYCLDCAGPDWIAACPDCDEVFEAEDDYWNWM